MRIKDYWPILFVPTLFWFALFLGADPPEEEPDPCAPIVIEIDLSTVEDITPEEWRE